MKLEEFKGLFVNPFPRAVSVLGFGLDAKTFPGQPREHPFVDLALPATIEHEFQKNPVKAIGDAINGTKWWGPMDSLGTTYLDLKGDGWTFRTAHFIRKELNETAQALLDWGHPLMKGYIIGPAGNAGRTKAMPGGSGRHIHAGLMLDPGRFDDVLTEKWGDHWRPAHDLLPGWINKYGAPLAERIKRNRWDWMNEFAAGRIDPWTDRPVYMVNWTELLED